MSGGNKEDVNIGLIMSQFTQIQSSLSELRSDQRATKDFMEKLRKEIKDDYLREIHGLKEQIKQLREKKLDKDDFKPLSTFFQKANRLVRSILIASILALVFIANK